jgi:signal transduction histidine kinase
LSRSHPQLLAVTDAVPQAVGAFTRAPTARTAVPRYVAGVLALAVGYFAAGRASLALQFDGPVAAVWLPSGMGAATLYLAGLRWWPGVLLGDLALADSAQPIGSALGVTAGNIADIVVITLLLTVLLGPRCALDRREDVSGMLVAIAAGAAITASVAVVALRAGDVIPAAHLPEFWRSWFLADASGSLVVVPLALAWAQPRRPLRQHELWEGALILAAVVALSAVALSSSYAVTYIVFPALIWAALRFGQRGGTLAIAVAAGLAVFVTAREVGPFVQHSITDTALSTQLYVAVAAVTTLFLGAIVAERRQAARQLADARNRIVAAADAERRRIERDLHDGAQQQLLALALRLNTAVDQLQDAPEATRRIVAELGPLVDDAIADVRSLAAGIHPTSLVVFGLATALRDMGRRAPIDVRVEVDGTERCRPEVEAAVYFCCSEAIQNAAKHAGTATAASATVSVRRRHDLHFEVRDDGPGFAPADVPAGGGLANMRERIAAVGGTLTVRSSPGDGATVIGDVPRP